jgi:simple sugar transport system permease protein
MPELAAVVGLVCVWVFFALAAGDRGFVSFAALVNYAEVAAQIGVVATSVTLLMIAGEFDLSVGSMIGFTAVITALLIGKLHAPLELVVPCMLAVGAVMGYLNGYIVARTKLPSFLVTLAGLFVYRGAAIGITLAVAGTPVLGGLHEIIAADPLSRLFAAQLPGDIPVSIVWWLALAGVGTYILAFTSFGNWIFGTGGSDRLARQVGVPTDRVRKIVFTAVGISCALLSLIQVFQFGSAEAGRGAQKEFECIITAVIGGTMLTGGVGSPIGTVLGALTLAMVRQGLFFLGIEANWYQSVLGTFLLASVLINQFVRRRTSEETK